MKASLAQSLNAAPEENREEKTREQRPHRWRRHKARVLHVTVTVCDRSRQSPHVSTEAVRPLLSPLQGQVFDVYWWNQLVVCYSVLLFRFPRNHETIIILILMSLVSLRTFLGRRPSESSLKVHRSLTEG